MYVNAKAVRLIRLGVTKRTHIFSHSFLSRGEAMPKFAATNCTISNALLSHYPTYIEYETRTVKTCRHASPPRLPSQTSRMYLSRNPNLSCLVSTLKSKTFVQLLSTSMPQHFRRPFSFRFANQPLTCLQQLEYIML